MILESRSSLGAKTAPARKPVEPLKPQIVYDDFAKVDLRVARIVTAEAVQGAAKLLRLTIDLGEEKLRTIFAGIKKHYDPEKLVGKRIVVVANLAPRKMKFGVSEGMLLAAADGDEVLLLAVDGEPAAGSTIS